MLKNGLTYFQNLAVTIFQHDAQKGFQLTFTCSKSTLETLEKSEICSMLTIITPEWRHWRRSGALIVNFEQISYFFLEFLLLTFNK